VIIHFAANTGVEPSVENPRSDCITNVIGTLNYLEGARINSVKRFVFASSGAPVGECTPPIHEEMPAHPVSPYGASKLAGEGYCSAYFRSFGINTVVLRFGNVYGPGSGHKNSIVAKFIRQAFDGETLEIYGDGSQTRDFLYIDDLINAAVKAASVDNVGGEIFQIATYKESTINEITEIISRFLKQFAGLETKIKFGEHRKGDVSRNFSDVSKAKSVLGWIPRQNLEDGIKSTILWFITQKQ
jgi:UDP-glucose 4-epimerase